MNKWKRLVKRTYPARGFITVPLSNLSEIYQLLSGMVSQESLNRAPPIEPEDLSVQLVNRIAHDFLRADKNLLDFEEFVVQDKERNSISAKRSIGSCTRPCAESSSFVVISASSEGMKKAGVHSSH